MKLLKSDLLLKSEHFPTFNDIASKLHKCLPFLPYLGGKKYRDLCLLGEKYSKGTIVAMEPVPPSSLSNSVIHRLFIAIIQVIQFFCGQAAKGEDTNLGNLCSDISNAMNRNKREDYLFTCLEVPSDNIKLAVVKCLDKIPLDEIDLEEFGHVVRVLGSYKNLGVGKTEEVLAYIFLLLTKITRNEGSQGEDFRSKLGEMVIVECYNILARNQERNLLNDPDEHEEKMSLTASCVFFLRTASKYKNLKQHMNNTAAVESLKRILKAEEIYSKSWDLPVDVERTWTGRSVDNLLKCFQGASLLVPYHEVSMRTMARLADVLMNKREEPMLDPWKSGGDDILESLQDQIKKREEERHREEEGIWEEIDRRNVSDDEDVWRQGHLTFVQTKAIDFLLNYLMGRNSLLGTELDAKLKSEYKLEYKSISLLPKVKEKLQRLEKKAEDLEHAEETKADQKLTLAKKEEESVPTQELIANALQGETLDEAGATAQEQMDENLIAAFKGNRVRERDLKVKSRMLGAYLRCIKAAVEHSSSEETREQVVDTIRNPKFLMDLTMLCATTQWKYGAIAGKYLRVVKYIVQISPKDNEAYDEHVSFLETVSTAVLDILRTLVPKLGDRERNPLNSQDQFLIAEVTNIAAIMCRSSTINRWSSRIENKFDEATSMVTMSVQDKIVGFVIRNLLPMETMRAFTEIIFYEMAFTSRFKPLAYKRSHAEAVLMDRARVNISEVFGYYMTYCYKLRYQVLEMLQTGLVFNDEQLRNTYMQDLLNKYQSTTYANELGKYILKNHLAFQVGTSNIPERIMHCEWTDVAVGRTSRFSKLLFILTSRKIYILNPSSSPPCPMCGPERFCPSGPTLKTVINYEDIRLIIRFVGMPQMMGLEFKSGMSSNLYVFFFPEYDSMANYLEKIEYITHISNRMKQQPYSCLTVEDATVLDALNGRIKEDGVGTTAKAIVLCSYKSKSFSLWKSAAALPDLHFAVVTDKNSLALYELSFDVWTLRPNTNLLPSDFAEVNNQNPAIRELSGALQEAQQPIGKLFRLSARIDSSFIKNVFVPEGAEIRLVLNTDKEHSLLFSGDLALEVLQRTFMKPIISSRPGTKVNKELSQLKAK